MSDLRTNQRMRGKAVHRSESGFKGVSYRNVNFGFQLLTDGGSANGHVKGFTNHPPVRRRWRPARQNLPAYRRPESRTPVRSSLGQIPEPPRSARGQWRSGNEVKLVHSFHPILNVGVRSSSWSYVSQLSPPPQDCMPAALTTGASDCKANMRTKNRESPCVDGCVAGPRGHSPPTVGSFKGVTSGGSHGRAALRPLCARIPSTVSNCTPG